ncbi:MAG: aldo/keto reductase [Chloroflexi bacterium]|nr:aldo/keto reductase [Chloroflexota bacterium]
MRQRILGRTGQAISEIGFGCGNMGGLLVRGERREQVRAVARAIELGITYFDTAAQYGDGASEQNLGRALAELKAEVLVGTKINVTPADLDAGPARVRTLFLAGLARLGRESVDVLFYHGRIRRERSVEQRALAVADVLGPLLDGFRSFQREGRVRWLGFTGLGDTEAVLEAMQPGTFDLVHCYFNALNPSAGYSVPRTFQPQDLGRMIDRASAVGMGVLAIRILAGGALAGVAERHPLAGGTGGALIDGTDYDADTQQAERLRPLADELGISLAELAIRFALSKPEVACALIGPSSLEHVELAARAAEAGPLPIEVGERILGLATRGNGDAQTRG